LLIRIAIGTSLGAVIGYERDRHGRPAGLRTHMLVGLAASTFMVVSINFVYFQHYVRDDLVTVDTSRIGASIVTGIGFLAGGAILRNGLSVQGVTTAAGLWLVTAIGMSAGAGMFVTSAAVTAMGVTALTVLRRFEDKDDHMITRRVRLVLANADVLEQVITALKEQGVSVSDFDYDRRLDDEKKRTEVTFDMSFRDTVGVPRVIACIEKIEGVRRVQVERRG
jgi:putative Mg2+ transporter-C (MgtC) family protein